MYKKGGAIKEIAPVVAGVFALKNMIGKHFGTPNPYKYNKYKQQAIKNKYAKEKDFY